jgi:hypothetical protein
MANNPGAKKAIRKIERRIKVNKARRSRVRTYLRRFDEALAAGDSGRRAGRFHDGLEWAYESREQGCFAPEHRFAEGLSAARSTEETGARLGFTVRFTTG